MNHHKLSLQLFFVFAYIILCITASTMVIDDAFITFQYSKNFGEFGKPWYNLDPTYQGNGQTSILWMFVLSIFPILGLKIELFFLWVNIGLGSFLILKLIEFLNFSTKKIIPFLFNFSVSAFFTYWLFLNSIHGLETVFVTFILYLFLKNWDKNVNYFVLLLPLSRPEFSLFVIFWLFNSKLFSPEFFKRLLISFGAFALYGLYYLVFFDYLILLPFLYKSKFNGFSFALSMVYLGFILIFLPAFFWLLKQKKYLIFIPLNILIFYYIFYVNSYSSGIFQRYYFPLMSIYLVYKNSDEKYFRFDKTISVLTSFILIFSALRMADLSKNFWNQQKQILKDNVGFYNSYQKLIDITDENDKISVIDAGYTAYFSKAMVYDGAGLNDATAMLSRKNNDSLAYRNYFKDRKINFITLGSTTANYYKSRADHEEFAFKSLKLQSKKPYKIFAMDEGFYLFVYYFEDGYHF